MIKACFQRELQNLGIRYINLRNEEEERLLESEEILIF
jgi:hypothetical protein